MGFLTTKLKVNVKTWSSIWDDLNACLPFFLHPPKRNNNQRPIMSLPMFLNSFYCEILPEAGDENIMLHDQMNLWHQHSLEEKRNKFALWHLFQFVCLEKSLEYFIFIKENVKRKKAFKFTRKYIFPLYSCEECSTIIHEDLLRNFRCRILFSSVAFSNKKTRMFLGINHYRLHKQDV